MREATMKKPVAVILSIAALCHAASAAADPARDRSGVRRAAAGEVPWGA